MSYSRLGIMDLYDLIRRWHDGHSISAISRHLSRSRKTVRHYLRLAQEAGFTREEPLPERQELLARLRPLLPETTRKRPAREELEAHEDELRGLITRSEEPLKPKTAFQVLQRRYDLQASYSTFKRFVRDCRQEWGLEPSQTTCRIETPPGEQVQVDYAHMGLLEDSAASRRRVVYAFIATLSYSRLKYVEYVFTQRQQQFVGSHCRMFEHFGGVPRRITCDNLKSGVLRPDLYDPQFNPLYQEMADHYGCFLDPARVARPKDKGKVERVVPQVRELFRRLKELRGADMTLQEANSEARRWCLEEDGRRTHATTKCAPRELFGASEQDELSPLPEASFEMARWKQVTVHPDQYVQFDRTAYSVPARYVGDRLWARGTERTVELYDADYRLVKTHVRSSEMRQSDLTDFSERVQAALASPGELLEEARQVGPQVTAYLEALLGPGGQRSRRKARAVLDMADDYPTPTLEEAARQALDLELFARRDFLQLARHLREKEAAEKTPPISEATASLVRPSTYFVHS